MIVGMIFVVCIFFPYNEHTTEAIFFNANMRSDKREKKRWSICDWRARSCFTAVKEWVTYSKERPGKFLSSQRNVIKKRREMTDSSSFGPSRVSLRQMCEPVRALCPPTTLPSEHATSQNLGKSPVSYLNIDRDLRNSHSWTSRQWWAAWKDPLS